MSDKRFALMLISVSVALIIIIPIAQNMYSAYAPDWMRVKPPDLPVEAEQVDLSVRVLKDLSDAVHSTALEVYVFDANKEQVDVDASDTTTGLCVFQAPFWEGEQIYLQLREAAPNSAGYVVYTSDLISAEVPEGDVNGDAQLPDIIAVVTTTSVATFSARDQGGNAISGTSTNYLNDSDASLRVEVVVTTDDTWFGTPVDFIDMQTGYSYLGGIFVVLTFNATQDMAEYEWYFAEGSSYYYVYRFDAFWNDADIYSDGAKVFTLSTGSTFDNGGAAGANASLTVDIFDTCKLTSTGGVTSQSFMNGDSDLNPSVITTLVHE